RSWVLMSEANVNDPRKSDPDYIDPAILKERAAVRDMTEVLAKHRYGAGSQGRYCQCGAMGVGDRQANHTAHVAQALAAAGFGHVASAEAERDEAAEAKVAAVKDEGAAEALDDLRERLVAAEQQL